MTISAPVTYVSRQICARLSKESVAILLELFILPVFHFIIHLIIWYMAYGRPEVFPSYVVFCIVVGEVAYRIVMLD